MTSRLRIGLVAGAVLLALSTISSPAWSDCSTIDGDYRLVFRGANVDLAGVSLARDGDMFLYVDEESPKESPPVLLLLSFDTDDGGSVAIRTAYGPKRAHR